MAAAAPPPQPRYLDPRGMTEAATTGYLIKVDQHSVPHGQCRLWTGGLGGSDYPRMRLTTARRPSTQYGVHQIVYSLNFGIPLDRERHDVSHKCHNRLCVNIDHLSYEPRAINVNRNTCKEEHHCRGHGQFRQCIL